MAASEVTSSLSAISQIGVRVIRDGREKEDIGEAPCGWDPEDQPAGVIRTPPDQVECDVLRAPLGPLLYASQRALPLEPGAARWGARTVWTLRIRFASGRYYLVYLDPDTHLELRRDYVRGAGRVDRLVPSGYTWARGVAIPAVWEITIDHYPLRTGYVARTIEVNP